MALFEPTIKKLLQWVLYWCQLAIGAAFLLLLLTPEQLAFTWGDSTAQVMGKMLSAPLTGMVLGLAFASGAKGMVGQPTVMAALLNPSGLAPRKTLELLGLKQQRTKSIDSSRIDPFNSPVNLKMPRRFKFRRNHHRKRETNSQQ